MLVTELPCLVIVAFYVSMRLRAATESRAFVLRFVAIVLASAIGENSMIAFYGAYAYAPTWSLSIGHVPVVVVLVWPVVVDSALVLASQIAPLGPSGRALVAAAIVFTDALLIEPIAVFSGLWSWAEGGLFHVPLLGIAGWAFFTFGVSLTLEKTRGLAVFGVLVAGPGTAHALVLASHWVFFRWVRMELPPDALIAITWTLALFLSASVLRWGASPSRGAVLLRAPGAVFFFALLAVGEGDERIALAWFALPFSMPYWVMLRPGARSLTTSSEQPASPSRASH